MTENREMDLELRAWQADDRDSVVEAARDPYGYFVLERFRGRGDV